MSETARTVIGFILGALSGVIISVLSILMNGAGHGWGAAVISCFSILTAPLAGIAWSARKNKGGRICGGASLMIAAGGNCFLVASTASEGFSYIERVWDALPVLLVVWFVLFLGWQFLALAALLVPSNLQPRK